MPKIDELPMEAPFKASKLPWILVLLTTTIGVAAWWTESQSNDSGGTEDSAHTPGLLGPVQTLETFVVNLTSNGDELRYLKSTLALELHRENQREIIAVNLVAIRHEILTRLSDLTLADTVGAANKDRIRQALHDSLAPLVGKNVVKDVYVTEFLVQ